MIIGSSCLSLLQQAVYICVRRDCGPLSFICICPVIYHANFYICLILARQLLQHICSCISYIYTGRIIKNEQHGYFITLFCTTDSKLYGSLIVLVQLFCSLGDVDVMAFRIYTFSIVSGPLRIYNCPVFCECSAKIKFLCTLRISVPSAENISILIASAFTCRNCFRRCGYTAISNLSLSVRHSRYRICGIGIKCQTYQRCIYVGTLTVKAVRMVCSVSHIIRADICARIPNHTVSISRCIISNLSVIPVILMMRQLILS